MKKHKFPVASTDSRTNNPYSFVINLVQTPYDDSPFPPLDPLKPEKRPGIPPISKSLPRWASRLSGLEPRATSAGSSAKASAFPVALRPDRTPYYRPATSFSLSLADRSYAAPPFDIGMLDAKRKNGLHHRTSVLAQT
jgi:hypothetical protein